MRYAFGSQTRARIVALTLLGFVLTGCVLAFYFLAQAEKSRVPGLDISGEWEFDNAPRAVGDWNKPFPLHVVVPDPLPQAIKQNLAKEYWYRKRFDLPAGLEGEPRALYLGSVKGAHEVYWNGKYLGGGASSTLGIYPIPRAFLLEKRVAIAVKVAKVKAQYPGIVQMDGVIIGHLSDAEARMNRYYFGTAMKPLIASIFKLALFMVFLGLFASVPRNREYFSFSLFCLLSGLSALFFSRFCPFYKDTYIRESLIFVFSAAGLAIIPSMTADLLRLGESQRFRFRLLGYFVPAQFLVACFFAKNPQNLLNIFSFANKWMPALIILPSIAYSFFHMRSLGTDLKHRKFQIGSFAFFLGGSFFASSMLFTSLLSFELAPYRMFMDLIVTAGMGVSLAMDFRFLSARSAKAAQVIPKWFTGAVLSGIEQVTLELSLVVIAVDTVAYTKALVALPMGERDKFHEQIRAQLAILSESFGAQKISERGDGGIFAWDLPEEEGARRRTILLVLEAAGHLTEISGIQFRSGISAGRVRAEMRAGDISFLGQPLNTASRLEGLAEPGTCLVDEKLAAELEEGLLETETVKAELKGVPYEARPLRRSA